MIEYSGNRGKRKRYEEIKRNGFSKVFFFFFFRLHVLVFFCSVFFINFFALVRSFLPDCQGRGWFSCYPGLRAQNGRAAAREERVPGHHATNERTNQATVTDLVKKVLFSL